jgi:hypothetical protein
MRRYYDTRVILPLSTSLLRKNKCPQLVRHKLQGIQKGADALKKYENMTFSGGEIDAFLPAELKRSNREKSTP